MLLLLSISLVMLMGGCLSTHHIVGAVGEKHNGGIAMEVKSVFGNNERIPTKYGCEGEDVNPELEVSGIPEEAKSLAIIMDDPDAPGGTWVHWVAWNIPIGNIEEGTRAGVKGKNSWGKLGYGGPCPPRGHGIHHYHFKVYALDSQLTLAEGTTKEELLKAMEEHIVGEAELVGLYSRD
ncbi:MAG: YbhB/YbcL family Raf kinase inhibitor-like protein [Methanobacteriota archaeon]|nr:MAG: YbhB/YbcL family Raf kinase inhibitor-like protein [Euryarchaeota archaeon]